MTTPEIKACEEVWERWELVTLDPTYTYLLIVELRKALKQAIAADANRGAVINKEAVVEEATEKAHAFLFSKLWRRLDRVSDQVG